VLFQLFDQVIEQTGATCDSGSFYEHRLLTDALEQVELADRLGIDYLWLVEHHVR
jgi:alkanesulfonate monooxygenase SsuD/methylene tetrahydromethanopterin reductase-like flavin-dependent oxidoreductase (luciferase family)